MDARSEPSAAVLGVARPGIRRTSRDAVTAVAVGTVRAAVDAARGLRVEWSLGGAGIVPFARSVRDAPTLLKAADLAPDDHGPMEDDLVATGRFIRIETHGERSGLARPVTVGFVEDELQPGALLVAAGSSETSWARNLLADQACRVTTGDRTFEAIAEPLDRADHARAVRGLILRYGTPAEGLGHGTSFRLSPVQGDAG